MNPLELQKRFVQSQLENSFIEKAHKDGDIHPSGKYIWVSSANKGKGDWRTIKKNKDKNAGSVIGNKSWDKTDNFFKNGTSEKKLWDSWYKFQKSGNPMHMSAFRMILEGKFKNIPNWSQTSPNTGKSIITAKDSDGNNIASIDLGGDKIELHKLQTFMDKCNSFE